MPKLNKDRIFNESKSKVLIREFENLKKDFTKNNAYHYYTLYENESLSFIIENAKYIFAEPYRGCGFIKNIMENVDLPFHKISDLANGIYEYTEDHFDNMSDSQKELYKGLVESTKTRVENSINSIKHASLVYEDGNDSDVMKMYDAKYEIDKNHNIESNIDIISEIINRPNDVDIMDLVNIVSSVADVQPDLYKSINKSYNIHPETYDDYYNNSVIEMALSKTLSDNYVLEKVEKMGNFNLMYKLSDIASVDHAKVYESVSKVVENYDPNYIDTTEAVNRLFEDEILDQYMQESYTEEKLNILFKQSAILEAAVESLTSDLFASNEKFEGNRNSLVEKFAVESTILTEIPYDLNKQIELLESVMNDVDNQIMEYTRNGLPNSVIYKQTGGDLYSNKKKETAKTPYYNSTVSNDHDTKSYDVEPDEDDNEDDDDDKSYEKRKASKKRRDDKYASMEIDDDLFKEDVNENEEPKTATVKVEKPAKPNVFRRVSNKALDANVQFKKKLSNFKRKSQDARNAGKAVGKIPNGVVGVIKQQVDEWDEMDDNKRKEYIIKPGVRKKYFKAFKIGLEHFTLFNINPLFNIILAIYHKLGNAKDIRIRNELTNELNTEIKVCEEKINDANSNGDNDAKYKLMRIRDKLEAERARVGMNSKYI